MCGVGRMKRVALKQHCVWCREDEESGGGRES